MSVRTAVEQGKSFVEPLRAAELFPHMVSQMVGIGEQTGALDSMLGKIADFYEQEVDSAIANLLTLIEPVLILGIGVVLGSVVIAILLPTFQIGRCARSLNNSDQRSTGVSASACTPNRLSSTSPGSGAGLPQPDLRA